ncbi:MAG TPA: hypothetical protein VM509_05455 [Planctomycetota bacterium]|nr:hypothetical protein [Planctomycetota bacterium]
MPLVLGCFALAMPRVVLVLVWMFSDFLGRNSVTGLWAILGFIFLPLTTLAYAFAHQQSHGTPAGIWLALVIVAVLVDLGLLGSSRRKKKSA